MGTSHGRQALCMGRGRIHTKDAMESHGQPGSICRQGDAQLLIWEDGTKGWLGSGRDAPAQVASTRMGRVGNLIDARLALRSYFKMQPWVRDLVRNRQYFYHRSVSDRDRLDWR